MIEVNPRIQIPESELQWSFVRAGGPGGQNVNKVETRVTIEVPVDALPLPDEKKALIRERLAGRINREGVLRVTSQVARTQADNRDRALTRMEELLRGISVTEKLKTRIAEVRALAS